MTRFIRSCITYVLTQHSPVSWRISRVVSMAVVAGLSMASCDVHGISEAGSLSTIAISPDPKTLVINGPQQFTATGTDFSGASVAVTPVWSIEAGGGTISASGLFTAGTTPGNFPSTVKATSGGISSRATVIVIAGALASIDVTPTPASMAIGATQQYVAVGKDVAGNILSITPDWSIVAGGGTISTAGLFTAGTVAATFANTVRASSGGISGTATVTVNPGALTSIAVTPNPAILNIGLTQTFTAVGTDIHGNIITIAPVWSVVNGGGNINITTGQFTAGTVAGAYANTVRATSGSTFGQATVIVTPSASSIVSITVTPNPVSISTGSTQTFAAVGRDGGGNIVAFVPVWTVVNGGGTIGNSTGLFTAGSTTGTFANTVTATRGTVSGTATVNVISAAPAPIVDLGTAEPNGIMAGTAFTCIDGGIINADISLSPGSTVTGFGPCIITGTQHLNDGVAVQAQIDLTNAYNTLAGLPCPPANAIVANLGGTTKTPGVYCTASGINVTGTLTLDGGGDPNATFVFQAGTSLITAGNIVLINGAQAKNVYWQVGSSATLGTASHWQGNILTLTSITLVDNATLFGRALARNGAVSMGSNNVITLP